MARSSIATDNFGAALSNWSQINPNWGNVTRNSGTNAVHGSNAGAIGGQEQAMRWNGSGSFTNDQYSSIEISLLGFWGNDYYIGVCARASADTDGSRDYYYAIVRGDGGGPTYGTYFGKIVNGTNTAIHNAAVAWTTGDKIELECEGTTIRVCKNGSALGGSFTATDSSLTTGKPGVVASGAANTVEGDNWDGGNITGAGGGGKPDHYYRMLRAA